MSTPVTTSLRRSRDGKGEDVGHLISSLQERAGEVKENELGRFFRRHNEWSNEERRDLERSIDAIVSRLLHHPIVALRQRPDDEPPPTPAHLFRHLFHL